jgi:hypothetical protein
LVSKSLLAKVPQPLRKVILPLLKPEFRFEDVKIERIDADVAQEVSELFD